MEVDTRSEIKVQLSVDYISTIREWMEEDGDLGDTCIGEVTIDGQNYPLMPRGYTLDSEMLEGNNGRVDEVGHNYLYWYINRDTGEPDILTLFPRDDYTIEAIKVVDMYWLT